MREFGVWPHHSEAWQYYEEGLRPGNHVVVVGPSHSIFRDALGLLAAVKVYPHGHVYFADPIGRNHHERIVAGGPVAPVGNIDNYLAELKVLKACGLQLAKISWLGLESGIFHIPRREKSIDVIIDHNTSAYVYNVGGSQEGYSFEDFFLRVMYEYMRVLRPEGKIFMQMHCVSEETRWNTTDQSIQDKLISIMHSVGLVSEHVRVSDVQRVFLSPRSVYERMRQKHYRNPHVFDQEYELDWYIKEENGELCLVHKVLRWDSPDMFLAVKRA